MCGLFGMMTPELTDAQATIMQHIVSDARERGTDAIGWMITDWEKQEAHRSFEYDPSVLAHHLHNLLGSPTVLIGNVRAQPTTEWFGGSLKPEQLHPFDNGKWCVVHNGVIANDHDLVATGYFKANDSPVDSAVLPGLFESLGFPDGLRMITGSYAVLAIDWEREEPHIWAGTNYKPLYEAHFGGALFLASQAKHLTLSGLRAQPFPQYSAQRYDLLRNGIGVWPASIESLYPGGTSDKAIVIASGGLDSTVAATHAVRAHGAENVTLLHFSYGCRAQGEEWDAVREVSRALDIKNVQVLDIEDVFKVIASTSPLLDDSKEIHTDGDAGAEFAYEWVPARNLIFLSLATAFAENTGAEVIYTGTNLEESGAYPDNEPEFINRLNHLMPYAVADGKRVRIEDPVGNMMKHGIVRYGLDIGAPLEFTWSCYYSGEHHCGECGPCKMRKVAFEMNHEQDPVEYLAPNGVSGVRK